MSIHPGWKLMLAFSVVVTAASTFAAEPPAAGKSPDEKANVGGSGRPTTTPPAAKKAKAKTPVKPRVLVTISKETTRITAPLRSDGYPDYVAALNERLSKGVTPQNNAAVPFWQAMGPAVIAQGYRTRFFRMLGIPPLPEKGDYFVTSKGFVERHEAKSHPEATATEENGRTLLFDQIETAMKRPWSKQEFPVWAEWLETNQKPMALLVEACRRPRRYEPLISGDDNKGMMIGVLLPGAQESRECARALTMRAMFRAGEGKVDEAWSDLLDCHRLARLADEGAFLVDGLVAISVEGMAQAGDRALLQYVKLTAAQIAAMRDDFDKLPRLSAMADRIDLAERFSLLDCTSVTAREGPSGLTNLEGGPTSKSTMDSLVDYLSSSAVDWDIVLRINNSWFDRSVAAARKPTRAERAKAMTEFNQDIEKMAKSIRDPKSFTYSLFGNPRKAISERIGLILVTLLFPAASAAQVLEDREAMQWEVTKLVFALAAYHAERGSYPAKLADLVPTYVKRVPKDIFNNDADLHYTLQDGGYLLYSVGANGRDDGGKGDDDRKNNEDWDDLTVRMSAAQP
jgi:hypothetical protein